MTLTPYLQAPVIVQIHVLLAATALFIGPFVLWRTRRDRLHKALGYVWVLGMGGAAISALFIKSHFTAIGLGPIHLLSLYTLWGIYIAMAAIFRRDVKTHRDTMQAMYVRGLCLAGAFNFLPGRSTQRALIPDHEWIGFVVIGVTLVWAFAPLVVGRLRSAPKNTLAVGRVAR
ncbi:MAG: DUF2306 domain-containing protein [Pseudomonadota bacterium]